MKQRIITGIFIAAAYIATILGTVLWNPVVFDVFAVFIMFAAGYEVLRCTEAKFAPTVKGFYMVAVALEYIAYKAVMHYLGLYYALAAVMLLTVIFAVIVLNFTMFSKKYEVKGGAATAFVLFYPALPLFIMLSLAYLGKNLASGAVIMVFLSTSLADTMAYFVGSALKGPKFCPEISPKKTVAGAVGGIAGGLFAGLAMCAVGSFSIGGMTMMFDSPWADVLNWIIIGIGSAVFCEMGDLLSSYVKRVCGIKDFGNVLAGHGGFMDRVDGLIISSVFIFAYMSGVSFLG